MSVMHFTTGAGARRLGTVEHIRLSFIALAASKDVVVEALAVVMRFNDSETQTSLRIPDTAFSLVIALGDC